MTKYAIIQESSTDDGYGGRSPIREFVPVKSEQEAYDWINNQGKYTKYEVIIYETCQVQQVTRILVPVNEPKRKETCNCGSNICPICLGY